MGTKLKSLTEIIKHLSEIAVFLKKSFIDFYTGSNINKKKLSKIKNNCKSTSGEGYGRNVPSSRFTEQFKLNATFTLSSVFSQRERKTAPEKKSRAESFSQSSQSMVWFFCYKWIHPVTVSVEKALPCIFHETIYLKRSCKILNQCLLFFHLLSLVKTSTRFFKMFSLSLFVTNCISLC